jgi:hypothetical protein
MWPVKAETAPREDKRPDVEPIVDESGADRRALDDPREVDEWMPDEGGYGYGV